MLSKRGNIVCSLKGRDRQKFMIVLGYKDGRVLVTDGKERPLENPKLKNEKHISLTNSFVTEEQMLTNRTVRHALNDFKATTAKGEI